MTVYAIANAIDAHLKLFEADRGGANKDKSGHGLWTYYNAYAHASGRYVRVTYISYQGSTPLEKVDAERYLKKLNEGFVGRHWEALR